MPRHMRLVQQPAGPRRLNSRREIDEWVTERRRVLDALIRGDQLARLGCQLELLEEVAV